MSCYSVSSGEAAHRTGFPVNAALRVCMSPVVHTFTPFLSPRTPSDASPLAVHQVGGLRSPPSQWLRASAPQTPLRSPGTCSCGGYAGRCPRPRSPCSGATRVWTAGELVQSCVSATCISVAIYERAVREQCSAGLRAVLHSIKTQAWVMSEEECYDSIMWRMVRTTAAAAIVLESARTPAVLSPGRCSCGDCAQPAHSAHRLPLLLSPLFPPVQSFRMNF